MNLLIRDAHKRIVELEAHAAYSQLALSRAESIDDPLDRALLVAVGNGMSVSRAALMIGLPKRTASRRVRAAMGLG